MNGFLVFMTTGCRKLRPHFSSQQDLYYACGVVISVFPVTSFTHPFPSHFCNLQLWYYKASFGPPLHLLRFRIFLDGETDMKWCSERLISDNCVRHLFHPKGNSLYSD